MANDNEIKDSVKLTEAVEKQKDATKELTKAINSASELLKKFGTKQKEYTKDAKAQTKATDELAKSVGKLKENTNSLKEAFSDVKTVTLGIIGADALKVSGSMLQNIFKLESGLHRTLILAGKGKKEIKEYKNIYKDLSATMGATYEQSKKIVSKFAELQFEGTGKELKKAAESTYALSKAYNLNEEEIAANTVELQKWGGLSASTTTAMYADIMKVSKANGLTRNGVQAILKSTKEWSGMLRAFGKAPGDVQKYNISLTKTVSALEKVGISAQTTTKLLEELTDPENIENNIPKYAALGISITDAISGNIDPEKMGEGLKAFGEKLKQMGPIAGSQYAKAMGVSYKDAMKAVSSDMSEVSKVEMTPEEKASENLKKAMEETKNITEKIESIFQKIGGKLRKISATMMFLLPTFLKALKPQINRSVTGILKQTKTKIKEMFQEVTEESLEAINKELSKQNKNKKRENYKHSSNNRRREKVDEKALAKIRNKYLRVDDKNLSKNFKKMTNSLMKKSENAEKNLIKNRQKMFGDAHKKSLEISKKLNNVFTNAIKKLSNLKIKVDDKKAGGFIGKKGGNKTKANGILKNLSSPASAAKKGSSILKKGASSAFSAGGGAVKSILKIVKNIPTLIKGIFKALGPIGIALGVVVLLAKLFSPIIERIKSNLIPILKPVLELIKNKFAPILNFISGVIANIFKGITKFALNIGIAWNEFMLKFTRNEEKKAERQNAIKVLKDAREELEKTNLLEEKKEKEENSRSKERLYSKNGGEVFVSAGNTADLEDKNSKKNTDDADKMEATTSKAFTTSTSLVKEDSNDNKVFMDEMYNINNSLLEQFRLSVEYSRTLIELFGARNKNVVEDINHGVKKALTDKIHVSVDNYQDFSKVFNGGKA